MDKKLLYWTIGVLCLTAWGCTAKDPAPSISPISSVKLVESGVLDGWLIHLFRDQETGTRVFCYNGSCVVLPAKIKIQDDAGRKFPDPYEDRFYKERP